MLNKIENIVKQYPNRIAYQTDNDTITYDLLWNSAKYYSKLLRKQGSEPVIIFGDKEIEFVISILSCILANRTYVPISINTPLSRIKSIIEITKASLVLSNNLLDIEDIVCCNLKELKKYKLYETKEYTNDYIYIIFTSGSTGIPKGVPITKANLDNFITWISNLEPLCTYENKKVLNQANFSFDLSVADFYYSLCNGHTLISLSEQAKKDYNKLYSILEEIDIAVVTPTFMKMCLLNKEFNINNFYLKCIYFCGEKLEYNLIVKIFDRFPDISIINAYGPTEATSAVCAINISREMLTKGIDIPIGDINNCATKIEIMDNEIILKGTSVFNGYLNSENGGYYQEDGINCYKTGDLGYIKDNKIYFNGRKDNQIKYMGYRIELDEIEKSLNRINGISDCVVIAKYDTRIVKIIKAFVVVDINIDVDYIRNELKKILPYYMIPKVIRIIDKIPVNQNGKLDRKALDNL